MKIIFDLREVGLGNNGGSFTLIKSGNTLKDLGHEVVFVDYGRNIHTWTKLKAEHIIVRIEKDLPRSDVIIATGYKSVIPTIRAPKRCGTKFHYIRGWETWQMPVRKIVNTILKAPTIKIVNSICLQRKLKEFGVDSHIIRPGYDLNELYPEYIREKKNSVILGGLYTKGKHVKIKRTNWIFDCYLLLKKRHKNLKLWLFGNDMIDGSHSTIADKFFYKPSMEQKNSFYNNVDIWLSPATQEGLHMPPAEAMMTGCPVVGTNADMSGTEDYLIHSYSGIVAKNDFQSFLTCVENLVLHQNLRIKLGENARKKIESLGDRKTNMQKLIDYFMGIIT